jgi:hypothetical protein
MPVWHPHHRRPAPVTRARPTTIPTLFQAPQPAPPSQPVYRRPTGTWLLRPFSHAPNTPSPNHTEGPA